MTRRVAVEQGRVLGQIHSMRLLADYTDEPPEKADAIQAVALAESFLATMSDIVNATTS